LRKLSPELARLETAARAARAECHRLEEARALEAGGSEGAAAEVTADDGSLLEGPSQAPAGQSAPPEGASRVDQVLAAARRREEGLRIAIGDCRAEIFKVLVRSEQLQPDDHPSSAGRSR